ncbi:MAG: hypothetical protein V1904_06310, partial [Bacteroidota bacterium]
AIILGTKNMVIKNLDTEEEQLLTIKNIRDFFWNNQNLFFNTNKGYYQYNPVEESIHTLSLKDFSKNKASPAEKSYFIKDDFEVWKYVSEDQSKKLILRLAIHMEDVISINSGKNFLYSTSNSIILCDEDGRQCNFLTYKMPNTRIEFKNNRLFFIIRNNLYILDFFYGQKWTEGEKKFI